MKCWAERAQGRTGLILLDREGRPRFASNTPRMARAHIALSGSLSQTPH